MGGGPTGDRHAWALFKGNTRAVLRTTSQDPQVFDVDADSQVELFAVWKLALLVVSSGVGLESMTAWMRAACRDSHSRANRMRES